MIEELIARAREIVKSFGFLSFELQSFTIEKDTILFIIDPRIISREPFELRLTKEGKLVSWNPQKRAR